MRIFWGGDLILLSPKDGEYVMEVVKDVAEWFASTFLEVIPWNENCVPDCRFVWIRCFGIPVHAWTDIFLERLASEFGSLVSVDGNSRNPISFEFCRLLIKSSFLTRLDNSIGVAIDGKDFAIWVREEEGGLMVLPSRKEVVLSESFVSDSLDSDEDSEKLPAWISNSLDAGNQSDEMEVADTGESKEREAGGASNGGQVPMQSFLNLNYLGVIESGGDQPRREAFSAVNIANNEKVECKEVRNVEKRIDFNDHLILSNDGVSLSNNSPADYSKGEDSISANLGGIFKSRLTLDSLDGEDGFTCFDVVGASFSVPREIKVVGAKNKSLGSSFSASKANYFDNGSQPLRESRSPCVSSSGVISNADQTENGVSDEGA
ncbi:unnamed protein product [Lupinus luteus]|uniref:DUF4283 domain-containing protein n=1 Tax=Lupinus luteus TaxID=3873 RepID=A0AAV1XE98_LUPLU